MRKFLISLLLATAIATPALAERPKPDDRAAAQERHPAHQDSRPQPAPRGAPNFQAPRNFSPPPRNFAPPPGAAAAGHPDFAAQRERPRFSPPVDQHVDRRPPSYAGVPVVQPNWDRQRPDRTGHAFDPRPAGDSVATWRQQERDQMRQERFQRGVAGGPGRVAPPPYARPDRPAPLPPTAYAYSRSAPSWDPDWRQDQRYNWHDYRERHRSVFRVGIYYDPFGWGYQPFGIGWRLWPAYYEQSFWINDPYMYDLPYAPWPYEWVRYYDDALLVNVYTGEVADVIHDFFW